MSSSSRMRGASVAWRRMGLAIAALGIAALGESARAAPVYGGVNAAGYALPFFSSLSPELDGLRVAARGGTWGYVDSAGKWVLGPQFTGGALPFVNGRAIVWDAGPSNARVIDRSGARIGDAPAFIRTLTYVRPTEDARLFTFLGKHPDGAESIGVIAADGTPVVVSGNVGSSSVHFRVANGQILQLAGTGNSQYDVVRIHDLAGKLLIDRRMPAGSYMRGRDLLNDQYYAEFAFYRDRALRKDAQTGRFGYIDPQGNWAIPPQYAETRAFHDAVTVALTRIDYGKEIQDAVLIDTQGRKVASLPKLRCVSAPENGLVYAVLPPKGKLASRGVLFDYKATIVAEMPNLGCVERTPWLDDHTLLIAKSIVSKDGKVLQDGQPPVFIGEYVRIERDKGIAIVDSDSNYAGEDLAEMRARHEARMRVQQAYLSDVLLRPLDLQFLGRTMEPAFNRYWAMRIYKQGDYLYEMIIEVHAVAGRSVQDGDKIAAVAGCRPPANWLLVRKGLVFPADRKDPLEKLGKQFDAFRADAFGGAKLFVNSGNDYCQHGYVVDGPIP